MGQGDGAIGHHVDEGCTGRSKTRHEDDAEAQRQQECTGKRVAEHFGRFGRTQEPRHDGGKAVRHDRRHGDNHHEKRKHQRYSGQRFGADKDTEEPGIHQVKQTVDQHDQNDGRSRSGKDSRKRTGKIDIVPLWLPRFDLLSVRHMAILCFPERD